MAYLAQRDVPGPTTMSDGLLLRLVVALKATGYSFTTITLATHARVNSRFRISAVPLIARNATA